jgi:hypothetical protein
VTRRERLEAKVEKRRCWAESAEKKADAACNRAHEIGQRFEFGQPILVGHHSERKARRDAERIDTSMGKAVEQTRLAQHHQSKARGLEHQLDRTVFDDDDDAIEKLEARAAEAERSAEQMNAINKAWRKTKGTVEERVAAMVAGGAMSERHGKVLADTMKLAPWLKTPFDATNLRAAARRDRQRIDEIKMQREKQEKARARGVLVLEYGATGVEVTFCERPTDEVLDALRAAGFVWRRPSWHGRKPAEPTEAWTRAMEMIETWRWS